MLHEMCNHTCDMQKSPGQPVRGTVLAMRRQRDLIAQRLLLFDQGACDGIGDEGKTRE